MPVPMSTMGVPMRNGPVSGVPLMLMVPAIAWMKASYPGSPPSGPSAPKPVMWQRIRRGNRSSRTAS